MYKLCKSEQSARRQRQLEEGLLALMLTRHYDEISVSDLCDALQLPRKSFYRYFSGKEGALQALLDHTLMEYESFPGPYQPGQERTMQRDMERFFLFWVARKPLLDALHRNGLSGMLMERSITHALAETVLPSRFLPMDSGETRRHIIIFSVCGLMSMVLTWHREGYTQSPEQMARVACRLLDKPLFPNVNSLFQG